MQASDRATFIVMGDKFMEQPGSERAASGPLHVLPLSACPAIRNLLPMMDVVGSGRRGKPRVIAMSQLTADMLKSGHVVYVGRLAALGLLRDPLTTTSDFTIDSVGERVVDRRNERQYEFDSGQSRLAASLHHDSGFVACFAGPSGNGIAIVSGSGNAAVMQMTETSALPQQLD